MAGRTICKDGPPRRRTLNVNTDVSITGQPDFASLYESSNFQEFYFSCAEFEVLISHSLGDVE